MNQDVMQKIAAVKEKYAPLGFIILGVFGSYARGDEGPQSDVDVLYEASAETYQNYPGLRFIALYEEVKNELSMVLGRTVDLADKAALGPIGRKYILSELRHVA